MRVTSVLCGIVCVACGSDDGGGGGTPDAPGGGGSALSDMYPGDVGLGADPAVIWFEDFEAATLGAVTDRYDQVQGAARMQLVTDRAGGQQALALTAGGGVSAVDLYKRLPDHDDVYVRWYVKYDAGVSWHHSGMWIGGYNPGQTYPSPGAGTRPTGSDRFSIAIEPVYGVGGSSPRFDFYNYWMGMHSWMATPSNDGTSYYGNALVHKNDFTIDEGQWVCLELHVTLNPSAGSGAGAVLELWKHDAQVARFDDSGPMGYWIRDKFCPSWSDGSECTDFPAPANEILDFQARSTTAYGVNAFWPQNYISTGGQGTLRFDQMVVATSRIGCMR
jgi:hypothetical protein